MHSYHEAEKKRPGCEPRQVRRERKPANQPTPGPKMRLKARDERKDSKSAAASLSSLACVFVAPEGVPTYLATERASHRRFGQTTYGTGTVRGS